MDVRTQYEDNITVDKVHVPENSTPSDVIARLNRKGLKHSAGHFTTALLKLKDGTHKLLEQDQKLRDQCSEFPPLLRIIPKYTQLTIIDTNHSSQVLEFENSASYEDVITAVKHRFRFNDDQSLLLLHPSRPHIKITNKTFLWDQLPMNYPQILAIVDFNQLNDRELRLYGEYVFYRHQILTGKFMMPATQLIKSISLYIKCLTMDTQVPASPSPYIEKLGANMGIIKKHSKNIKEAVRGLPIASKTEAANEFVKYSELYSYLSFGAVRCMFGVNAQLHKITWSKLNAIFVCSETAIICMEPFLREAYARIPYKIILNTRRFRNKIEVRTTNSFYKFFFEKEEIFDVWHYMQKFIYTNYYANKDTKPEVEEVCITITDASKNTAESKANSNALDGKDIEDIADETLQVEAVDLIFFDDDDYLVKQKEESIPKPSIFADLEFEEDTLSKVSLFQYLLGHCALNGDSKSIGLLPLACFGKNVPKTADQTFLRRLRLFQKLCVTKQAIIDPTTPHEVLSAVHRALDSALSDYNSIPGVVKASVTIENDTSQDSKYENCIIQMSHDLFPIETFGTIRPILNDLSMACELYEGVTSGEDKKKLQYTTLASSILLLAVISMKNDVNPILNNSIDTEDVLHLISLQHPRISNEDSMNSTGKYISEYLLKKRLQMSGPEATKLLFYSQDSPVTREYTLLGMMTILLLPSFPTTAKLNEIFRNALRLPTDPRDVSEDIADILMKHVQLTRHEKEIRIFSWPMLYLASKKCISLIMNSDSTDQSTHVSSLRHQFLNVPFNYTPSVYQLLSLVTLLYKERHEWSTLNCLVNELLWQSKTTMFRSVSDVFCAAESPAKINAEISMLSNPYSALTRAEGCLELIKLPPSNAQMLLMSLNLQRLYSVLTQCPIDGVLPIVTMQRSIVDPLKKAEITLTNCLIQGINPPDDWQEDLIQPLETIIESISADLQNVGHEKDNTASKAEIYADVASIRAQMASPKKQLLNAAEYSTTESRVGPSPMKRRVRRIAEA